MNQIFSELPVSDFYYNRDYIIIFCCLVSSKFLYIIDIKFFYSLTQKIKITTIYIMLMNFRRNFKVLHIIYWLL